MYVESRIDRVQCSCSLASSPVHHWKHGSGLGTRLHVHVAIVSYFGVKFPICGVISTSPSIGEWFLTSLWTGIATKIQDIWTFEIKIYVIVSMNDLVPELRWTIRTTPPVEGRCVSEIPNPADKKEWMIKSKAHSNHTQSHGYMQAVDSVMYVCLQLPSYPLSASAVSGSPVWGRKWEG